VILDKVWKSLYGWSFLGALVQCSRQRFQQHRCSPPSSLVQHSQWWGPSIVSDETELRFEQMIPVSCALSVAWTILWPVSTAVLVKWWLNDSISKAITRLETHGSVSLINIHIVENNFTVFLVKICVLLPGIAEGTLTTVAAAKSVKKKKPDVMRRRSSDGFAMLLSYQSRLENLYNQTLRTQVQLDTCLQYFNISLVIDWLLSFSAVTLLVGSSVM